MNINWHVRLFLPQGAVAGVVALLLVLIHSNLSAAETPLFERTAAVESWSSRTLEKGEEVLGAVSLKNTGEKLALIGAGDRLLLNLVGDESVTMIVDRVDHSYPPAVSWIGRIEGHPLRERFVLTRLRNAVAGRIPLSDSLSVRLDYRGNGLHDVVRVNNEPANQCGTCVAPELWSPKELFPEKSTSTAPERKTGEDILPEVDLLVAYTPAARIARGGHDAINASIANAVALANIAYENSEIPLKLQVVHSYETPYHDTDNLGTDLGRFSGSDDGFMDEVHALRNQYAADAAALIVDFSARGIAGVAWRMGTPSSNFSGPFSVVASSYLVGDTLAHELGHNMGCSHDPGSSNPYYPFAVGHYFFGSDGEDYRTIMSGRGGKRIVHFSNPDVSYLDSPTGVPIGVIGKEADASEAIRRNTPFFINWRSRNDAFGRRAPLTGANVLLNGRNLGYTLELDEPVHTGTPGGGSAWWSWTPSTSGLVTIETDGSEFDTLLAIYTGTALQSLSLVAANDDISGENTSSRITMSAEAGIEYQIVIAGNDGAQGNLKLALAQDIPAMLVVSPQTYRERIPQGTVLKTSYYQVANLGGGEMAFSAQENAVWFDLLNSSGTADHQGVIQQFQPTTASLGIGRYTGQIRVTAPSAANQEEIIDVELLIVAVNERLQEALALSGASGVSNPVDNFDATVEKSELKEIAGTTITNTLWYSWTANETQVVEFTTEGSSIDTLLAAYSGPTDNPKFSELTLISESDNLSDTDMISSVAFPAEAGQTYYLQAGGKNNVTGELQISWAPLIQSTINDWNQMEE